MKHSILLHSVSLIVAWGLAISASAEELMAHKLRRQAHEAIDQGLHYLRTQEAENGSWSGSVGVTGLALRAFLESPRGYNEADGAFITRPVNFILSNVQIALIILGQAFLVVPKKSILSD